MRDELPTIRARGARLFVIGSGSPQQAQFFREDLSLEAEVYSDRSKATYEAVGMKRGFMSLYHPKSALHMIRALRSGARNHRIQGDPMQQGGVLVVDRGGRVRYAFASDQAGDHPPVADILSAIPDGTHTHASA